MYTLLTKILNFTLSTLHIYIEHHPYCRHSVKTFACFACARNCLHIRLTLSFSFPLQNICFVGPPIVFTLSIYVKNNSDSRHKKEQVPCSLLSYFRHFIFMQLKPVNIRFYFLQNLYTLLYLSHLKQTLG